MTTILYLLLTLVILSIMVIIHELGHFLFARLFKVTVLEFSVGMGPAIFTTAKKKKKKKSDSFELSEQYKTNSSEKTEEPPQTENAELTDQPESSIESSSSEPQKTVFSIRALPIGGYVSMAGEDDASNDVNAFCNKKPWQKLLITLAGPVMNILLGILCMCILVGIDASDGHGLASNVIADFRTENSDGSVYESTSDKSAEPLMAGDRIIKVENVWIHTGNELVYEITNKGYEPIDLTVERNGERIVLHDVVFPVVESQGVSFGDYDFVVYAERSSFTNIVKHAFWRSFSTVKMILDSIVDLVGGRYGAEAVSGPVGVSSAVGEATKAGFYSVLYLFTVITVNLGVFNLLPLPALDGGRIIFCLIEIIFRRPVKKEIEHAINTVGLALLMVLALFITVKDIFQLF